MTEWCGVSWPVRTERLVLRPSTAADIEAVFAYRSLEEIAYWNSSWPRELAAFRAGWETLALGRVSVLLGDALIGDVMVRQCDGWAQHGCEERARGCEAELGCAFSPEHHGLGYAAEAVQAGLAIAFDGLGVRRVWASAFAANTASWRLLERIGMRREAHTIADGLHRDLGWLDGYNYALLADEWRAQQSGS